MANQRVGQKETADKIKEHEKAKGQTIKCEQKTNEIGKQANFRTEKRSAGQSRWEGAGRDWRKPERVGEGQGKGKMELGKM